MDDAKLTLQLKAVGKAAQSLRAASTASKNAVLETAARLLSERASDVIAANQEDLGALKEDATNAFKDRLTLNPARLAQMGDSLKQVAALADPVDEEVESRVLDNGLKVRRVRAPLGVILMIFESRPNVAVESWSLAFKSGNAIILRGGKESMRTTGVLYSILSDALTAHGLPAEALWGITDPSRELTHELLQRNREIDIVVPRGGDSLIEFVVKTSRIPIIKNDRGLCHVYVHDDADLAMAARIVTNAKTQRPGVCNAMETLLVSEKVAEKFLPLVYDQLSALGVEWYVCPKTAKILAGRSKIHPASKESFDTEYLELKMSARVVPSLDAAIAHIEQHGSRHSESIVTSSEKAAREFQSRIDAAAVYWNASTRFTDGYALGLGGELGISTQKLHVRGPVGLRELTSARWIIDGSGQIRT